jgi:Asp-tRNA(Asn)/Glu-tRNA(Gln) amidotransferase B subunit
VPSVRLTSLPLFTLTSPFVVYEIHRQRAMLESASDPETVSVPQETRGFDEHRFETYSLRSKEDAPDYRYMPDPNLGTLVISEVCSRQCHCGFAFIVVIGTCE